MEKVFVDTNYFLRILIPEIQDQAIEVIKLFSQAANQKVLLITSEMVLFEIAWIAMKTYSMSRADLCTTLIRILSTSFIELPNCEILLQAVALFSDTSLSLIDCYNLCYAKEHGAVDFATFDKKLQKAFLAA